jgi:4-hydroxyacetophenone monooxygenase
MLDGKHPSGEDAPGTDWLPDAIEVANIPTLLMVLVQLTGDLAWLEDPYRPARGRGIDTNDSGGLPAEVQRRVRDAATDAIRGWIAGTPVALPDPPEDLLRRMLSVAMGEPIPVEYAGFIADQPGICDGQSPGAATPIGDGDLDALIIGAGPSGLAAAIRLQRAGIRYSIAERTASVGGVWQSNRYPGAGVDTPGHLYAFSFAPHDWEHYFALRSELADYFEKVSTDFDVSSHISFETEVLRADWDPIDARWNVEVRDAHGQRRLMRPRLLISAVGLFDPPLVPDIPGLASFAGPAHHTARWPEGLDLRHRRVAVIGNGASSVQLVPAIVEDVEHLTIFQRTPQWMLPFDMMRVRIPDQIRLLFERVPLYTAWYRLRLSWLFNDRVYDSLKKDPEWAGAGKSVSRLNEQHRQFLIRHITSELGDREDLIAASVPDYPPFAKRILLDTGWYRALRRDNVSLVTDKIVEVTADSIVTSSGESFDVDVIAFATGFGAARFISSYEVYGIDGVRLRDVWSDDNCTAYMGLTVPGFPNFFTLYGPNTQAGHGGSAIYMIECQINYMMSLIEQMGREHLRSVEVRSDVHERYNAELDEAHSKLLWTGTGVKTYYTNEQGRVVVNSPYRNVDIWLDTRAADLSEYLVSAETAGADG